MRRGDKKYRNIYFDLDRTLWDYETNARTTFYELVEKYQLEGIKSKFDSFISMFNQENERLWEEFREGKINKNDLRTKRFTEVLAFFNIHDKELAHQLGEEYLKITPTKGALMPGALETLSYLHEKYQLYIITNGFGEVQETKLENSGLNGFFKKMITSDTIGIQKPHPAIFHHALTSVHAKKAESLMVGDDLVTDIMGARRSGIDQVFLNTTRVPHDMVVTYEINTLLDLKKIL